MPQGEPEGPVLFGAPQILRKYGVPKPKFDKSKYSKAGKEQHPVKVVSTKRPITKPPTKDKAVLNSVRWAPSLLRRWAGQGDTGTTSWQVPGRPDILGGQTSWAFSAPGALLVLGLSTERAFHFIHKNSKIWTMQAG